MKYICTIIEETGREEIFIFPKSVNHDCMEEILSHIKTQSWGDWKRQRRTPVSAGFISSEHVCYGRSETLNLESRPEDTQLLETLFGEF